MKKIIVRQLFVVLIRGGADQNKWLYEFTEYDETKLHRDAECVDEFGLTVERNLYEVTREELNTIQASEDTLKMSIQVFVKEGEGKIRFFDPHAAARRKKATVAPATHLFAQRCMVH